MREHILEQYRMGMRVDGGGQLAHVGEDLAREQHVEVARVVGLHRQHLVR